MITQLISFFLPQNSFSSEARHVNGSYLQERLSFNIPQDHRRMNVRVSKIAFSSLREQKFSSSVSSDAVQSSKKNEIEDFPLGRFMRFLKHVKLKNLLKQVTDPRDPKKQNIKYT